MPKNKLIYIILISFIIILSLSTVVFGKQITVVDEMQLAIIDNPDQWEPDFKPSDTLTTKGSKIAGIVQVIGASVAVVTLMIIGIRYIIGSAEQKAEYKKTMIPYIIGAVMIFAISTFLNLILNIVQDVFK